MKTSPTWSVVRNNYWSKPTISSFLKERFPLRLYNYKYDYAIDTDTMKVLVNEWTVSWWLKWLTFGLNKKAFVCEV